MRNYTFFLRKGDENEAGTTSFSVRSKDGRTHVAMLSDFFSSVQDNLFCTNAMYKKFMDEVLASIGICSVKEKITVDVFETKTSKEDDREILQLGFRRYVHACYMAEFYRFLNQLIRVSLFAVLGLLLIIFIDSLSAGMAAWLVFFIETLGTVLIWQFFGYWAFEFSGQRRRIKRLRQIEEAEYSFRKWE